MFPSVMLIREIHKQHYPHLSHSLYTMQIYIWKSINIASVVERLLVCQWFRSIWLYALQKKSFNMLFGFFINCMQYYNHLVNLLFKKRISKPSLYLIYIPLVISFRNRSYVSYTNDKLTFYFKCFYTFKVCIYSLI